MDQKELEGVRPLTTPQRRGVLSVVGRFLFFALSLVMAIEWGRRACGFVPNRFDKFVSRDVGLIWVAGLVIYVTSAMWNDSGSPPKPGEVGLKTRRYAAAVYVILMVVTFIAVLSHK